MSPTAIEWTEETWNPVTGCSKVSPGCAHCYAETLSLRHGWSKKPWTPENATENVITHWERLEQPLRWRRPRMVFVNSMSDLFHEEIPANYVREIFDVMAISPRHTFQVLTKRPEVAEQFLGMYYDHPSPVGHYTETPLPNVWLGVSIENARYTWRADVLREIPAAVRFISAEPLLGSLLRVPGEGNEVHSPDSRAESQAGLNGPGGSPPPSPGRAPLDLTGIDWLIVGGESGPGARRMDPEWARELLRACSDSGTAPFVKQLGSVLGRQLNAGPKGERVAAWPPDLQVRRMPARALVAA